MRPHSNMLEAMLHCPYKAWLLSRQDLPEEFELPNTVSNPIITSAWSISHLQNAEVQVLKKRPYKYEKQATQLLVDLEDVLSQQSSPPYYKIPHCSICQFKHNCHSKLKEKDCISLLAGMTPKAMKKYHSKGITTITQLSYLFKPKRRRAPNPKSTSLYELKALAIREQKTFVIQTPQFKPEATAIYLDFEGMLADNHIYLLGGIIVTDKEPGQGFSFWSDHKEDEEANFKKLFDLLLYYPDTTIFHYGSYETKALKQAASRWPDTLKRWPDIEKRMINLLGYLRTHVYPPTYSNGLKELGAFLGFKWQHPEADGILSMDWRRQWEITGLNIWKQKLIQYNQDDCRVLYQMHQWFIKLALDDQRNVQQVSQMQRHTPYRLQNNLEFSNDFQFIAKAAYFNYQRDKIYWRNNSKKQTPSVSSLREKPEPRGMGVMAWQPKKINEVVIIPPRKACPTCGHTKLYQSHETKSSVIQTDLKFTASGVRQHVTEYRSGTAKCAKCRKKTMNKNLRIMHYGDNLFALISYYYVNLRISNELVSRLIEEQYHIWISTMYLVSYKSRWWNKTWSPVAAYIRKIVLNSPVIHVDETTIKLARESGYVWVFATTHTVFYHYAHTREVSFLQDLLKDYQGVIVSDFYPGYETLNVKSQKCLIHLIRDLNDDLFKNQFDQEYSSFVISFNKLLRQIIETIDKHGLKQTYLNKHIKETDNFYKVFVERDYKSEFAQRCAKRFKKNWEQLWTFLYHDGVPWNNNNAETAVKAFAQRRRGVKGQMHVTGITEYLEMLTVAQTCRYRNISFLEFLRKKKGIWENISPEILPDFLPFEQAKLYVHRLKLESSIQWHNWKQQGNRPAFIPSSPNLTYKDKGWVDWHDWLGTGFLPFEKARAYIRKLRLKTRNQYLAWLNSGKRPKNIPYSPQKEYKHTGWVNLDDWLGVTGH